MKNSWRALLCLAPVVMISLYYTSCKTKTPVAELRDTVADTADFSATQLKLTLDQETGDVVGVFDGSADGVGEGQSVTIKWGVFPSQTTVPCSELTETEQVVLKGADDQLTFQFKVPTTALQEKMYRVESAKSQYHHSAKGPLAGKKPGFAYLGHPILEGCLKVAANGKEIKAEAIPEAKGSGFSLQEGDDPSQPAHIQYAERCMQAIGYIPPINCNEMGQTVPITLNGVEQQRNPQTCDRPVYLPTGATYCNTNTRVGRLPLYRDRERTQLISDQESQAVFFCRHYDDTYQVGGPDYPYFSDVAVIMQNQQTGKSCFFQALGDRLYGHRAPPPQETDAEFAANVTQEQLAAGALKATRFWLPPTNVAQIHCVACHDNDPFMHSPWIDQVRIEGGDPIVPSMPFADYKIIGAGFGFERWDTSYAIEPNDNPDCANCHRVTHMTTCRDWLPDAYPLHEEGQAPSASDFYQLAFKSDWAKAHPNHHWMPPPWENHDITDYLASVKDYRRCCEMVRGRNSAAGASGFINRPTGFRFAQADLDYFDQNGCYVYQASEVIER